MSSPGPLVPARGPLSPDERRRASRHLLLDGFGPAAQERLAGARVLVVGAGGLGSAVLPYLAAAGVGVLGVLDDDVVDASNLQRQVLHGTADVGRAKTASAADALRALRPALEVVEHRERLDAGNALRLLAGYDVVVDGSDTFATRYAVSDAAAALGLPVVWGTVLGWDGQVAVWWSAAPGGRAITYPDVFGPQPPEGESCDTVGVLGPACGVVGATMAVEVVKLLTGTGDVALGRLLVYDARTSAWDTIELAEVEPHEEERAEAVPAEVGRPEGDLVHAGDPSGVGQELVLDVGLRPAGVPGAVHVRLEDLAAGLLPAELLAHPAGAPVVVVCEMGLRSRGAAALLAAEGWSHVTSRALREA
ncbi:HesA/MoeB/ThiF family protein [Antribacter sp. KLBMP9083]|uniref:HesA/MoeB/ThiF family protein n=1 Tax=Antribacter soli TaxID=2910976 RepID=A0AA41UCR5_9MICO|nr:HesA/MoeB/ThiF family protein [Antribacter soli]MCF4122309.1 HesA/MoeB/ThiF family protein [Antribacter soli]